MKLKNRNGKPYIVCPECNNHRWKTIKAKFKCRNCGYEKRVDSVIIPPIKQQLSRQKEGRV